MHKNVIEDYLSEISRVLVNDGKGIIHHSNLLGGNDQSFKNWGGRSNMGGILFKELVEKYGMIILDQKNIKINENETAIIKFAKRNKKSQSNTTE